MTGIRETSCDSVAPKMQRIRWRGGKSKEWKGCRVTPASFGEENEAVSESRSNILFAKMCSSASEAETGSGTQACSRGVEGLYKREGSLCVCVCVSLAERDARQVDMCIEMHAYFSEGNESLTYLFRLRS